MYHYNPRTFLMFFACIFFVAFTVPALPASSEVIVDNAKLRAVRIVLQPGETMVIEHPNRDRVLVYLQQGSAREVLPNGKTSEVSWNQFEARLQPAGSIQEMQLKAGSPVTVIAVELKGNGTASEAPKSPQNPWIVDPRHYTVEFENADVRVTRVKIGPKEATPLHEHSLDRIVVYLKELNFRIVPEGKQPERATQEAGAVAWGTPARHTEYNLSDNAFEGVVIEPKY